MIKLKQLQGEDLFINPLEITAIEPIEEENENLKGFPACCIYTHGDHDPSWEVFGSAESIATTVGKYTNQCGGVVDLHAGFETSYGLVVDESGKVYDANELCACCECERTWIRSKLSPGGYIDLDELDRVPAGACPVCGNLAFPVDKSIAFDTETSAFNSEGPPDTVMGVDHAKKGQGDFTTKVLIKLHEDGQQEVVGMKATRTYKTTVLPSNLLPKGGAAGDMKTPLTKGIRLRRVEGPAFPRVTRAPIKEDTMFIELGDLVGRASARGGDMGAFNLVKFILMRVNTKSIDEALSAFIEIRRQERLTPLDPE